MTEQCAAAEVSGPIGQRVAVGAAWLVAWRMVTRGLGLVSTLVLARILVPADFGLIAMATTFAAAVDALSELGLADALVRRREADRRLWDTAFTMQAIRGVVTGAVVAAGAYPASLLFGEPRLVPVLLVVAALAVAGGFDNIGIVEFRRSLRFDMEFRLLLVPRVAQFAVTVAAALLFQSYWALLLGIAVARLGRLAMTYVVHPYRPRLALSGWRELVGFSFWTWALSIAYLALERGDAFILGPALGPAALGVYLIAAEIAVMPITEIMAPATRALFPGFAAAHHRGTDTFAAVPSVAATLLLLIVPLSIGVSATSGHVVTGLLGPSWDAARPLIAVFAWLCVMSAVNGVCSTVLMAHGRVRQTFSVIACSAALRAGVMLVAAQTQRLDLAAYAALACVLAELLLFLRLLRRCGDPRWRGSRGVLARILASGVLVVAALLASGLGWQRVDLPPWSALLTGIALGAATMALFALLQAALWWLAGRPDGPERRVMHLIGGSVSSLRRRASV